MAIRRFKSRSTAGRRLKSGTLAQLVALSDIRKSVNRGDGGIGTLTGCIDSAGVNQGTTGILVSGVFYASGTLTAAGEYSASEDSGWTNTTLTIPEFNPENDFEEVTDNLCTLTLAVRGGLSYTVLHAHKRQINLHEHLPSGGVVRQGDVIWQFSPDCTYTAGGSSSALSINTPDELPLGSTLTESDGTVWTVLTADLQVWGNKWECACRNLSVESGLNTTVTIQVANYTKDATTGERVENWATVTSSLRAKIQPETSDNVIEQGQDQLKRTYRIILAAELSVLPKSSYRVLDSASAVYKMRSYHASSRIDQLPYLIAVKA